MRSPPPLVRTRAARPSHATVNVYVYKSLASSTGVEGRIQPVYEHFTLKKLMALNKKYRTLTQAVFGNFLKTLFWLPSFQLQLITNGDTQVFQRWEVPGSPNLGVTPTVTGDGSYEDGTVRLCRNIPTPFPKFFLMPLFRCQFTQASRF